jgi:uncharacterized repeat protein (TIGR01451 family)
VLTAGVEDDFLTGNGPELSSPNNALLAYMGGYPVDSQDFDGTSSNQFFGHTFTDLPPGIVGATLEIGLQVISGDSNNDVIRLAMTSPVAPYAFAWSSGLAALAGGSWTTGASQVFTLDLQDLPGGADILSDINSTNTLDVFVQDDTAVDYITLTIVTCPVDIAIGKTVSDTAPAVGDVITYQVLLGNLSGATNEATGIKVQDLLPKGVTYLSHTTTVGSLGIGGQTTGNPGTYSSGVWTINSWTKFVALLTIQATVNSDACGKTITNTATLTALDQGDTDPGNNSSTVDIVVAPCRSPDLELKKHIGHVFHYGKPAAYNIVIQNVGAGDAFSPITFKDILPNGIMYVSFTEPNTSGNWTCKANGQTVECTYSGPVIGITGVLPLLVINVNVVGIAEFPGGSDSVVNCATVRHKDDKNPDNDEGCVNTIITS